MILFEPIKLDEVPWDILNAFRDRTIYQTRPWLNFLAETQGAEPVIAAVKENNEPLGYFTGLIIKKFGVKILASPFEGWTTAYMGFNLRPEVSRRRVLASFPDFAFKELGCHHLEITDRYLDPVDLADLNHDIEYYATLEIDLTRDETEIYAGMDNKSCRWCIRKAIKLGVTIEEAADLAFADDYYAQLIEVFAKQSLVPTYGIDRVRSLIKHLSPTGGLLLLRARSPEGVCIATGIFPAFNDTMYFWGGASWRKYQSLCPNELLIWHAMKHWKARNIKKFDMGGAGDKTYKRKYGGIEIRVPRLRQSKYKALGLLRSAAKRIWFIRQRILGGRLKMTPTV